jgi:hypothetical protein
LFLFVATTAYTIFAALQWYAMRDQIRIARSDLDLNHRPWIAITGLEAKSPITFDAQGAHLTASIHFKNVGTSPARHVVIRGAFYTREADVEAMQRQKKACGEAPPQQPVELGWVQFPGVESYRQGTFTAAPADVEKLRTKAPNGLAALTLVGCIEYLTGYSDTPHHTGFIYEVAEGVSGGPVATINPDFGNVPVDKVAFEVNPYVYADVD